MQKAFKGLDIGSNKPSAQDQRDIPHHFIDVYETTHQQSYVVQIIETISSNDESDINFRAGAFAREARAVIDEIISRKKTPLLVGGSTLWMVSLNCYFCAMPSI